MNNYRLIGLCSPGNANIWNPITDRAETVALETIDDELAAALVANGCQFLELIHVSEKLMGDKVIKPTTKSITPTSQK